MNFEDMYICNKVYLYCKFGKYIQPLEISHNKNVKIQGIPVATERDNIVGKNFPHFGGEKDEECKCAGGKCKLRGAIKWQNVKNNVKIKGAHPLIGGSYFICPNGEKVTISEHNQSNIDMAKETTEEAEKEAAKTPNPIEIYKQLEQLFKDPEKREIIAKALNEQFAKEREWFKEYAAYRGVDFVEDTLVASEEFGRNPNMKTLKKAMLEYAAPLGQTPVPGIPITFNQVRTFHNEMMSEYEKAKKGGYAPPTFKEFANNYTERLFYLEAVDPEDIGTKISPEAAEFAKNIYKQAYLGNGTNGEVTLIGTGGEILGGMTPAGPLFDLRDVAFSIDDKDGWGALYSGLGIVPAAGDMVKRSPALMEIIGKLMSKTDNILESFTKSNAKLAVLFKNAKRMLTASKDTFASAAGLAKLSAAKALLKVESFLVYVGDVLHEILDMVLCQYLKFGCFSEGTLVKTEDGKKPIEDIKVGEKIYTYNVEKNSKELKEVTRTYSKVVESIVKIGLDSGEVIETTPEHPFYDEDFNYYEAQELKAGISLYAYDDNLVSIKSVEKIEISGQLVYNLETEENHNFYVGENEVLVHNADVCEKILKGIAKQIDDAIKRGDDFIKLKRYPNSRIMDKGGIQKGVLDSKGVPHDIEFKTKVLDVEINGKKIKVEVNVPDFSDVKVKGADVELPKELLIAPDDKQFKYVTEYLRDNFEPHELEKMFNKNKKVLEAIQNGETRIPGFTYHHKEGTGIIEVVDTVVHKEVRHVGGNAIHGQGVR